VHATLLQNKVQALPGGCPLPGYIALAFSHVNSAKSIADNAK
jgi:hypothetical protein